MLFPESGRQLDDPTGRVDAHALKHIHQVRIGIDAVQPAGADQALDDADVGGPDFAPAEQPVPSPHRDRAQAAFEMVRIDRHVGIAEEDFQRRAARQRIGDRLGQRMARLQIQALALGIAPLPEGAYHRFAVPGSVGLLVGAFALLSPDRGFGLVQFSDQRQRVLGLGIAVEGAFEASSGMGPALGVGDARPGVGITRIGGIAVSDQRPGEVFGQGVFDMVLARGSD